MSREPDEERRAERGLVVRPFNQIMPFPEDKLGEAMIQYLVGRNLSVMRAKANGWYPSRKAGDEEPRVVIPATASSGNVYWQARAFNPKAKLRYTSPYAPRGDALVVVWPEGRSDLKVVVAEGPMDALAAAGEGYVGVGLMGTGVPLVALDALLKMMKGMRIAVVMDEDQPAAMVSVMNYLIAHGGTVNLCRPYPHKDLAEAPPWARRSLLGVAVG